LSELKWPYVVQRSFLSIWSRKILNPKKKTSPASAPNGWQGVPILAIPSEIQRVYFRHSEEIKIKRYVSAEQPKASNPNRFPAIINPKTSSNGHYTATKTEQPSRQALPAEPIEGKCRPKIGSLTQRSIILRIPGIGLGGGRLLAICLA
jgi:hypothetical protein